MKRLILILALVVCSAPAFASVSLTQSNSAACATTVSCVLTLSGNTTAGNLLIFALMWGNQTGTIIPCNGGSCSTTCPTSTDTFSTVASNPKADPLGGGNEVYVAYAIASGALTSFTYCVTGGGNHTLRVALFEYHSTTGWPALASVLETSNVGSGTAVVTGTPGNVTPSSGDLIFAALEVNGTITAASFTVTGTGYTRQDAQGTAGTGWASANKAEGCDNTSSGSSATTCTFNWTGSSAFGATIAAFKPSPAGGVINMPPVVF